MDAAESEQDAKLYKASGVLLQELQHKLPKLLRRPGETGETFRLNVLYPKCGELRRLLDRFQEWPQLLDPALAGHVQLLSDAFTSYLVSKSEFYGGIPKQLNASEILPLPRAICQLLYTLCKVRGYKIVVRLLNNEPKYLAPMLMAFRAWNQPNLGMTWEERYIMLLWLSHLMLAPFELANISIGESKNGELNGTSEFARLPGIAGNVAETALEQLAKPTKEQDAASILLVRLALRRDMQEVGLPTRLTKHVGDSLLNDHSLMEGDPYRALGYLTLLHRLVNAGSDSELAPFLPAVFTTASKIMSSQDDRFAAMRDPAPARKLLLKILRLCMTHAISLSDNGHEIPNDGLNSMLEDGIQYFLESLGDKDTPVRMTAAKSLSIVALKLEVEMSAEVVEAVLGSLQENVLLEDPRTGKLMPLTDKVASEGTAMKRNISAVDPLKWHGLMLTLGHLLFRRSPPPHMLGEIIHALILGLEFEQRSNVGTSIGVGVRDAACFGIWAVARKYSTLDLEDVDISTFAHAHILQPKQKSGVLQHLACRLVVAACLDPSGNIRRGSSAALQELIGRHPDTIIHGIPVVQIVDYNAVARLSRSMIEVSAQAADLDNIYHQSILYALTEWRGSRAVDVSSRRWSADAVRVLTTKLGPSDLQAFILMLFRQLLDLKPLNVGSTAGARHGLLLTISACFETLLHHVPDPGFLDLAKIAGSPFQLQDLTGSLDGRRITADIELVMEAISTLVSKFSCLLVEDWTPQALEILKQCTVSSIKDPVVNSSADANLELFKRLSDADAVSQVMLWLDSKKQKLAELVSRGRIRTLSIISSYLSTQKSHDDLKLRINTYLTEIIRGKYRVETRVDAMEGLSLVLSTICSCPDDMINHIAESLVCGLTDYTNDQRGDIGSLLRLASIAAVDSVRSNPNKKLQTPTFLKLLDSISRRTTPLIAKLAAEKLNSVRHRAWICLSSAGGILANAGTFTHVNDVSSQSYYTQIVPLLEHQAYQNEFLLGLVSSATAGSDDICRAACNAFLAYMLALDVAKRDVLVKDISAALLAHLVGSTDAGDRVVVPQVDFFAFLLTESLFDTALLMPVAPAPSVWDTMGKIQPTGSSLPRVEACLHLYSRLLVVPATRAKALDKLTRMLLHRWPTVRNAAAEALYCDGQSEQLATTNWSRGVDELKPIVSRVRKEMGVVVAKTAA